MTEQKRKSTRNFNLEKGRTSNTFDLSKEDAIPVSKKKSKLLLPIIIVGVAIIGILAIWLFLPFDNQDEKPLATNEIVEASTDNNDEIIAEGELEQTGVDESQSELKISEEKSISEIPYKTGEIYKIYQFEFADDAYRQTNPVLDKLVKVLMENPNIKIQISAYTDGVGGIAYNQALSERRAKAIFDYLISKGIDGNRLKHQGKGISTKFPSDEENRRAEFQIIE